MVMPPMNRSVNGPLALRFKSSVVGLKTWMPLRLVSEDAWNAPVTLRFMKVHLMSQAVTLSPLSCHFMFGFSCRCRVAPVFAGGV